MTKRDGVLKHRQPLCSMRESIPLGVNSLLAAANLDTGFSGLYVETPSKGSYMQLNERFLNRGFCEMLKRKNFWSLNILFPILGAYADRETGFQNYASITGVCRSYSNIVSSVCHRNMAKGSLRWKLESCAEIFVRLSTI